MRSKDAIRRSAQRQGFGIRKSRTVHVRSDDYGQWMLFEPSTGAPLFGYHYDVTLEDIDAFLRENAAEKKRYEKCVDGRQSENTPAGNAAQRFRKNSAARAVKMLRERLGDSFPDFLALQRAAGPEFVNALKDAG